MVLVFHLTKGDPEVHLVSARLEDLQTGILLEENDSANLAQALLDT